MGPTGRHHILQIHPTRFCNLRCLHCYSSSGPEERTGLEAALLRTAISDAVAEGYGVVSFSGGEPLLYDSLPELLDHAHDVGARTQMTTNGMLLRGKRLDWLPGRLDLMAISLDGKPESHNRMRASAQAFERMEENLEAVRATGIPFGFLFTLTRQNLDELPWVAEFAFRQGAKMLQVHPLEISGRAVGNLADNDPDRQESAFALLAVDHLQTLYEGRLLIQLDLSHRRSLLADPERTYGTDRDLADLPLAEIVSPLVIEADGSIVPLEYGFARSFALGNLHQHRLSDLVEEWKQNEAARFHGVCARVHQKLAEVETPLPVVNWYAAVGQEARVA